VVALHICTTRRSSLFSLKTTPLGWTNDWTVLYLELSIVLYSLQNRTRGGIFITQLVNMNVFLVAGLSVSRFKSMWVYSCVLVLTFFHVLICAAQFLCCMFLCCAASPPTSGFCFTIPPSQVWWRLLFTIHYSNSQMAFRFSVFPIHLEYIPTPSDPSSLSLNLCLLSFLHIIRVHGSLQNLSF